VPDVAADETARTDVLAALQRLTTRQRAVVWLTYWLDLTPTGVADTLGISQRSVERELQHARTRLKGLLS
jgi:RNA polymerase sigma-70 factor (ECF subfamily)